MNDTKWEKLALIGLALVVSLSLTGLGVALIHAGKIDATVATVLGVIVGIFGANSKDILSAIRGYSMSAQLGRVTDQLAKAGPVPPVDPLAPPDPLAPDASPAEPIDINVSAVGGKPVASEGEGN